MAFHKCRTRAALRIVSALRPDVPVPSGASRTGWAAARRPPFWLFWSLCSAALPRERQPRATGKSSSLRVALRLHAAGRRPGNTARLRSQAATPSQPEPHPASRCDGDSDLVPGMFRFSSDSPLQAEKRDGCGGNSQQHQSHNQKGMEFSPAIGIPLLNRIQKRTLQRFHESTVTGTPIRNEEARTRLLGSDVFKIGHHNTAVAEMLCLPSLAKTNWYTSGLSSSIGWKVRTPSTVLPGSTSRLGTE